jgi:purine-binding chemotaxis protein CheW
MVRLANHLNPISLEIPRHHPLTSSTMETTPAAQNPGATSSLAGKYLTFGLADEAYGIPVLKVREIITMLHITSVPQMPRHVKGVINLRGKVIPVIDLRIKLGLEETPLSENSCIVVVQLSMPGGEIKNIGLIVDSVEEVANVAAEDLEPAPDFGGSINVEYLLGMAKIKGSVKSLLDIDKVIKAEEIKPAAETFANAF